MNAQHESMAIVNKVCDRLIADHMPAPKEPLANRPAMTVELEVTVMVEVQVWGETPAYFPATETDPEEGGKFVVEHWQIDPDFELEKFISTDAVEQIAREALD